MKVPIEARKSGKKGLRAIGKETWIDSTLQDWDENDYRIFCGDLGDDVTEATLTRAFSKYPSLRKTRVVRDRRGKTRGYGFLSFQSVDDYTAAMKDMNGKYVGSRPIKLRKSTWKSRNADPGMNMHQ